ncbi:hypothetical protein QJS10_CPB14g00784 [Acorus calamus]|uniref:Legume lectin domain-containing protein n=1 Tax=Acorus calamus TaxID=4465 RepID=A0AAV9DBM6_ACOCL|nr:hypothetical protein QJS10_CPB14g00784 [Acorus calamus]
MAISLVSTYSLLLVLLALSIETLVGEPAFSFSFLRFIKDPAFDSEMALFGDSEVSHVDSSIRILSSGRIMYRIPVVAPSPMTSLSTYFTFSVSNGGLAFVVIPDNPPSKTETSPTGLSVSFNASNGVVSIGGAFSDNANRISAADQAASGGERMHAWVDYNGRSKRLEVRLSGSGASRPFKPSALFPIDLSVFLKDPVFIALSASNATVYSWSFGLKHTLYAMHSEPFDPRRSSVGHIKEGPAVALPKCDCFLKIVTPLLFGVACGAIVASLVLFVWLVVMDRRGSVVVSECPVYAVDFEYEKISAPNKMTDNGDEVQLV